MSCPLCNPHRHEGRLVLVETALAAIGLDRLGLSRTAIVATIGVGALFWVAAVVRSARWELRRARNDRGWRPVA